MKKLLDFEGFGLWSKSNPEAKNFRIGCSEMEKWDNQDLNLGPTGYEPGVPAPLPSS